MARIAVVGDGPAGLSAALFLAKNGHDTTVYGDDDSLVEFAELHNYLGRPDADGTAFMDTARQQATDAGATLVSSTVVAVDEDDEGFAVTPDEDAAPVQVDYVVIAGGKESQSLAARAGAEVADGAVVVDGDAQTTVDGLYAAGHLVRPERSQAIISAGWGAAAAIDIISREAGRDVHDWDSPSD
ncbi:FAD-dependent oxidoreductase [Salsipaludibacter albus]|uniref:FAD-dependent oxidoreductase n=1 Tax=Salsipaludibacter albus TaxID=2849650 RepID=UPI001EE494B0|nr:FAD-dependent oxidoreductase [Salsipaludibacter albus]MBY5160957.1 FAD-dependent oxidoreductase [Salsipaludibacter albus]